MKTVLTTLALAATMTASAAVGTPSTQDGYKLSLEYEVAALAEGVANNHRSGVGINDKFFVNVHATGIQVYDKDGNLVTTIKPTEGYKNWVSCNVDAAGHLLAQLDVKAFDGTCSPEGKHGFMVIDTKTNEVLKDFLPMTFGYNNRFDAMAPVDKDILTDYNTRILAVLNNSKSSYQFSYNAKDKASGDIPEYGYWKTAAFTTSEGLEGQTAQTSTGYALQYTPVNASAPVAAIYANPQYQKTYSDEGLFGNSIRQYTGNWNASSNWYYTPMHSGLSGYNFFTLKGKDYIIYPAGKQNQSADAFAIAEVSYVNSPKTDMTMAGETLVDGKLAGTLKARVYAAVNADGNPLYTASTACTPSYTIQPVEGDESSVYIYVYSSGAPGTKWKFTVDKTEGVDNIAVDAAAENAVYYNLQGVRVDNPVQGNIYIKAQGGKATKVIF